jgi:hypothetical protein
MGKAEGSHTKAHDLSGWPQENRCGAESAVGEGEARRLRRNDAPTQVDI